MIIKTIKSICLNYLALLIIFYPSKINALTHEWIAVPKSQYGEQLWDQNSVQTNLDGFTRVLSKFVNKKHYWHYSRHSLYDGYKLFGKSFRDISVGASEFNEFENKDSEWKDPNGDNLIMGVIDQVCAFIN